MFRIRKTIRAVLLLLLLFIAICLSLIHIRAIDKDSINLYVSTIYKKFIETDFHLDRSPEFQKDLKEIIKEKFDDDSLPIFYFLKPDYVPPTLIEVPGYFSTDNPSEAKPLVQPFDPRFTIAVYLNWIRENPGQPVPFHWSDWLDFTALYKFILLPKGRKETCNHLFSLADEKFASEDLRLDVKDYCTEDPDHPLGFQVTRFPMSQEKENAKLLGKSFLYSNFRSPAALVFLTNSKGSYKVDLLNLANDINMSLLHNGMVESVLRTENTRHLDVLDSYRALLQARTPDLPHQTSDTLIELEESRFEVDAEKTIQELEQKGEGIAHMQRSYMDALRFSLQNTDPEKSFNEAKFLNSDSDRLYGDHHDWRFYNGLTIETDSQVIVLHRILKNYLHFCLLNGLVTWIAHGSLLSWYWNGMAFPWDADTDVQMPIRDLHLLAENFNQSLVIENIGYDRDDVKMEDTKFSGMGAYFIDVGNSITHRDSGNGKNNIDARFIDIQTGLYVDITGLSVSSQEAPKRYDHRLPLNSGELDTTSANRLKKIYNCRNRHFSSLDELSPLVKTVVQNEVAHVPLKFGPILYHEYRLKGLISNTHQQNYFLKNLRVWVKGDIVLGYLTDKNAWLTKQKGTKRSNVKSLTPEEIESFDDLTAEDHSQLLHNSWLLREYLVTREVTKFHEEQMLRIFFGSMSRYGEELGKFLDGPTANQALWGDLFMNEKFVHNWDYLEEVKKLEELARIYEAGEA